MHYLLKLALLAAALTVNMAGAHAAAANNPLPSVEDFFRDQNYSEVRLSPSGRYLAVKLATPNGREQLVVVNLSTGEANSVVKFSDADVGSFSWVNDERLLVDTHEKGLGRGDLSYAPGLYAVNRDGTQFRQLADRRNDFLTQGKPTRLLPWHTYMLGEDGAQNSEYVYVTSWQWDDVGQLKYIDLLRLNTRNGMTTLVERPGAVQSWLLDEKGEPRVATTVDKNKTTVHYLDPVQQTWRKLATFDRYLDTEFVPLSFGPDGTLYVSAHAGKNYTAVYSLNLATGKVNDKALVELDGYDFDGSLIISKSKLLGIRHRTDAVSTDWLDPAMKAIQAEVDALLPGTINLISLPSHPDTPNLLVQSYSDVQPRMVLLYNSASKALTKIGDTRPQIKPEQMAKLDLVRYAARDGLSIPAWLTLPQGKGKNLPMVVLVHGGPYVRGGSWAWDADAQFLASRGYAVLEPEFRGSTGFGQAHFQAGWKQWGLKMQNDIADGVRWAVAQGIADGKRVCIAGASYGGYATLMGLVNDPDLYQCGINWVGVTDIKLMYTGHWSRSSDLSDAWKKYGMPTLVGDLEADAEQLKRTSPLEQANRVTQALLLAYGGADRRVPIYHGKKFYEAVSTHNRKVEWVQYDDEGHGWAAPKNRYDFWRRVEKFLDQQIGPNAAAK